MTEGFKNQVNIIYAFLFAQNDIYVLQKTELK